MEHATSALTEFERNESLPPTPKRRKKRRKPWPPVTHSWPFSTRKKSAWTEILGKKTKGQKKSEQKKKKQAEALAAKAALATIAQQGVLPSVEDSRVDGDIAGGASG